MSFVDNAFTVLVMALMGGMVNLIVASGGVTAFKKFSDRVCTTRKKVFFTSLGIMAVTSIDDGLNMMCASTATHSAAAKNGIVREKLGLFYSMLPTVLSSFIPMSLWGIFVVGAMTASTGKDTISLFCKSIPFNFFSIVTVIFMVLLGLRKLPQTKQLKAAEERYKNGGKLWPKGSEKYLNVNEPEVWGKNINVILPIIVLAISSLLLRSLFDGSFILDSSCGLVAALIFMFIFYCAQGIMAPEQFIEHLITGIANSTLPIIMYLLTMCFSTLLESLSIDSYMMDTLGAFKGMAPVVPAVLFIVSALLTIALGSSWSMYAIIFPITVRLITAMGLFPALCIGAVAGAGIAGEKICMFTADALNVGTSIGCNPDEIRRVRIRYSLIIAGIAALGYLIAGIIAAI
jgi:Na+/H+ antiporter NhaC